MPAPPILHFITPLDHASPFDVNMAVDAGFAVITPYTKVTLDEVTALTQDMMFSRAPQHAVRTSLFIGGRDAGLALDMLDAARKALFPPFMISVFADPSGAFTTAAAMIAAVERRLGGSRLKGLQVQVYGATGVVGGIAGLMAAQAGAEVILVGHRGLDPVAEKAGAFKRRFGVTLGAAAAADDGAKEALLAEADVVLACARAGVEVLNAEHLAAAGRLKVAADVNAVPPAGIAGLGVDADGAPLVGAAVGIGALAIGRLKFQVQHELLKRMATGDSAVTFAIEEALALARSLAA